MNSELMLQLLGALLIVALIGWVLFLLTREFWCWYFKINERLSEMLAIKATLKSIERSLGGAGTGAIDPLARTTDTASTTCWKCDRPLTAGTKFCEYCGADISAPGAR